MAYPLIESDPITLDQRCKFAESTALQTGTWIETEPPLKTRKSERRWLFVWRYAAGTRGGGSGDIQVLGSAGFWRNGQPDGA